MQQMKSPPGSYGISLHSDTPPASPFLGTLQVCFQCVQRGERSFRLSTVAVGICVPLHHLCMWPAWRDSTTGVKEDFSVQILANSLTPSLSACQTPPGLLCWECTAVSSAITASGELSRKEPFSGGTAGRRLVTSWLTLLGCQRWCVLQACFTGVFYSAPKHQLCSGVTVGDHVLQLCFLQPVAV